MPTKRKWTRIAGRLWRLTLIPALCLPAVSAWAGNFVFLTIGGRAGGGATGINSHNDVVGAISTGGATSAGFYWHRGVLKEFSPPQGTRTILRYK